MVCLNCGKELKNEDLFCPKCGTKQNSESVFSLSHRSVLSAAEKFFNFENTSYSAFNTEFSCIKRSILDYFGNIEGMLKTEYRNCTFFNNNVNAKNFVCLISEKYDGSSEVKDSGVIIFTTNGFLYQKSMQSPQTYIKFEDIIDCKIMELKNQKNTVIHYFSSNEKKSLVISEEIYTPGFLVQMLEELSSDNKTVLSLGEEKIPLEMIPIPGTKTYVLAVPVVQRLYEIVMGTNPSKFKTSNDSFIRPVENVSQIDAFIFCNRLSVLNKRTPCYSYKNDINPDHWPDSITDDSSFKCDFKASGYRLLTPYEWEIAAKGNQMYQHAGGNKIKDVGWCHSNSNGETHSVKQKFQNGYRLYDMNGNVWEWVDSWNVVYGGSWRDGNDSYKFNTYKVISSNEKYDDVGFRIAAGPELKYEDYGYKIEKGSWEDTRI